MKKVIIQLFSIAAVMAMTINVNAQCPSYSAPVSGTDACANVPYYFEIPNTDCPSSITWTVTGNSGSFGNEISWQITNLQTGLVVASHGTFEAGSTSGNNFDWTQTIGPDPVANVGSAYNLEYHDTYGDGLTGGGNIEILDYLGNQITIVNEVNFSATSGNSGFATPQQVSNVSATITTSQGTRSISLVGCAPIFEEYTFVNPSFCSTTTENIAWSLVCDETSAVLESGNFDITVYPSIPGSADDLVDIQPSADGCSWTTTSLNGCTEGVEYTISPDPAATTYNDGDSGSEVFTVTYMGIPGGPDCCAVGGPAIPDTFVEPAPTASAVPQDSPFGGTNNAAFITTGPYGQGGVAVSGSFDVTVSGYDYPDPNRAADVTADATPVCIANSVNSPNFWTTIYVDGTLVSDEQVDTEGGAISSPNATAPFGTASVGGYAITISFADIQMAGVTFTENSVIEAYVYPNSFSGPSQTDGAIPCGGNPTVVTTFAPGSALANPGEWGATVIEISDVLFEFTELVPGPADCELEKTLFYTCTAPACTQEVGAISIP